MPSPASARTCSSGCSTWASTTGWPGPPGSGRRSLAIGPTSSPASSSGWPGPPRKARETAAARLDELAALARQLAAERSRLDELVGAVAEEQGRADEATAHARLLEGVRAPAGVDELATALATVTAARRRCAELEDEATQAVDVAEAQLAGLPAWRRWRHLRADHGRRRELAEGLDRGRAAEAEAAGDLAMARDAEERARGDRRIRAGELDRLRVESRALALTSELTVGSPCPVCGQEVHALPVSRGAPDLRHAERSLAEAERSAEQATGTVKEAIAHQARVDEKLGLLRADLAELDGRLAGAAEPEAIDDQLAVVAAADADLAKALQAVRDARAAARDVGCRHDELVAREREARRAFDAARDAVAVLDPPAAERRDLAADWGELVAWAAETPARSRGTGRPPSPARRRHAGRGGLPGRRARAAVPRRRGRRGR